MIGILDYGMGNLRSVQKAVDRVGGQAAMVTDPEKVSAYDKLILPGVGNFADGMRELTGRGFVEPLHDAAEAGVPLFGVCMGMQLLMDSSTEDAPSEDQPIPGLGLIPGRVVRFSEQSSGSDERLKVPHMGWNRLEPVGDNLLVAGLSESAYVYFVHSYYCVPMKDTAVAARATYGQPFCASICQGNLWACQFHPEKSQQVGLKILENFVGC